MKDTVTQNANITVGIDQRSTGKRWSAYGDWQVHGTGRPANLRSRRIYKIDKQVPRRKMQVNPLSRQTIKTLEVQIRAYQASYYNGEGKSLHQVVGLLWNALKLLKPDSPVLHRTGIDRQAIRRKWPGNLSRRQTYKIVQQVPRRKRPVKPSRRQTIKTLEVQIRAYQASYYNGEGKISDQEFDLLCDILKQLKPDSPVLHRIAADATDGFPKARHLIPMGSQEKAVNPQEFREWATKIAPELFVVQYKLDGASLELQYEQGTLTQAITRGDGRVGDEITRNARRMAGVLSELDLPFSGGVRGEVVMTRQVWKERYQNKANCRNAANGLMRKKDGTGCEDLSLICYDAAALGDDQYFQDELEKVNWLKARGFTVTETVTFTDVEAVIAYREEVAGLRPSLSVDIDGLVVKDRKTDMADLRRARPERQIAFKFDLEVAYSILHDVEWSESGATYTPIGVVEPVRLAGTTVQRANLNNPDMIRSLGLKIGSVVSVVKRGEIIPKIEGLAPEGAVPGERETQDILFPTHCGSCGTALEDGGSRLFCPNPECPKRLLHRLQKWVAVLDIRELGEKLLQQLFNTKRIQAVSDLYTLNQEEVAEFERMGELSAAKVIRHIQTPRVLPLAAFVAGFDFEGVGEIIMEKVVAAGFNTLDKLRHASVEDLAEVYGLGDITAQAIRTGLAETAADMDRVLAAGVIALAPPPPDTAQPLRGLSFCFTGELSAMKRSEASQKVKALGGSVKSTVVKDLSFLVTNDPQSGSSKNKKARDWGIPLITEEAFLAKLFPQGG